MLRPIATKDLGEREMIPQAIFAQPVSFFEGRHAIHFVEAHDDLDSYLGAALALNDSLPFALRHYRGHPENTTTLYLAKEISDIEEISRLVAAIAKELSIPRDRIEWQRSDNPEL